MAVVLETTNDLGEIIPVEEREDPAGQEESAAQDVQQQGEAAAAQETQDAQQATSADTSAATSTSPAEEEEDEAVPRGVQKRFDRLTRQREDARREALELRERLARLEGQLQATMPQQPETPRQPSEPLAEDYRTEQEYLAALVDYRTEQRVREAMEAERQQRQQVAAQQERERQEQAFREREAQMRQAHQDYDERCSDLMPFLSPQLYQALLAHETGPALAYHLAQHPEVAQRLAPMQPLPLWRELGKLEQQLVATQPASPSQQAATGSAPKPTPLTPVGSGGSVPPVPDLANDALSQREWEAAYERIYGKKRRYVRG